MAGNGHRQQKISNRQRYNQVIPTWPMPPEAPRTTETSSVRAFHLCDYIYLVPALTMLSALGVSWKYSGYNLANAAAQCSST